MKPNWWYQTLYRRWWQVFLPDGVEDFDGDSFTVAGSRCSQLKITEKFSAYGKV